MSSKQQAWTYLWWRVLVGLALIAAPFASGIDAVEMPAWPQLGWIGACGFLAAGWCRMAVLARES
jgi:hypothetical protein